MTLRAYLPSLAILAAFLSFGRGNAATESIIYRFKGVIDGIFPASGLTMGAGGMFYGTTTQGGIGNCHYYPPYASNHGCGTVFELAPPTPRKASWTKKVLYSFGAGTDGARPFEVLITDDSGALYGTTAEGGGGAGCGEFPPGQSLGCGTIFKLTPPATGQTGWTETVLYRFTDQTDGFGPSGRLMADASGALYGVTSFGGSGADAGGTVFRLSPPKAGQSSWVKATLHTFNFETRDGDAPTGGLIIDRTGALYGTTSQGGGSANCGFYQKGVPYGCGMVFKLSPPAAGRAAWKETVPWRFRGRSDGRAPRSDLTADSAGNLFGTTAAGGSIKCNGSFGCGTVFRLTPPATAEGSWAENILYRFQSPTDGDDPQGPLFTTSDGSLLGTTLVGGSSGTGTIFMLTPPQAGQTVWSFANLHSFAGGADGAYPGPTLTMGVDGAYYGITEYGGGSSRCGARTGCGTVYRLAP